MTESDASIVMMLYRQATDSAATKYLHKRNDILNYKIIEAIQRISDKFGNGVFSWVVYQTHFIT